MKKLRTELPKLLANLAMSATVYCAAPVMALMTGLMKFSVSEVMMPEKAAPISTPMAMSMTLPRSAKDLNSLKNFFITVFPPNYAASLPPDFIIMQ